MAEPRIQYAQTEDGVNIAYWTMGVGITIVQLPTIPFGGIGSPGVGVQGWNERITQSFRYVRYDSRGSGLSERDVTDFSLDAYVRDLEAVVDCLGVESFALQGAPTSGPVAIAYAARYPERVSHLLLWSTYARAADFFQTPRGEAFAGMLDKDWESFTESVAYAWAGWSEDEPVREIANYARESVSPETARAAFRAIAEFDVTNVLSKIRAPTLVTHRRGAQLFAAGLAAGLAARIPNARLVLLEGTAVGSTNPDAIETLAGALEEFLGVGGESGKRVDTRTDSEAERLAPPAVHTILFTDVEGSTALTQRLGDAKAREILREHERITREALAAHGGAEVKTMGDGFMTSFASATAALECAIAIQSAFDNWNSGVGAQHAAPLQIRIGLNAGEPIAEEEDLFGTAVNMAARICAKAEGGQILAPVVVRELVAGKGFLLSDIGETELRGFEDPVRLYEVSWREND